MTRRAFVAGLILVPLALPGCGRSNNTPERMFAAWLAREMDGMTDLSNTEQGPGQFTGSCKKDGKTWQIKASRAAHKASWEAKHEESGAIDRFVGSRSW
jgi:hypothetical protein